MGHIQKSHITNNNSLITSTEGLGTAGNRTLINQDEKFILDTMIADIECDYAPLQDHCVDGTQRVPLTFEDCAPNGAEQVLRGSESQDPKEF